MYGSDQAASIEAHSLGDFAETVRAISGILGTGIKNLSDTELKTREKLRINVT